MADLKHRDEMEWLTSGETNAAITSLAIRATAGSDLAVARGRFRSSYMAGLRRSEAAVLCGPVPLGAGACARGSAGGSPSLRRQPGDCPAAPASRSKHRRTDAGAEHDRDHADGQLTGKPTARAWR